MSEHAPASVAARFLSWAAVGAAALSIVLVGTDIWLFVANQSLQRQVNQRQAVINQAEQINRLDATLVRALARQAASQHDDTIREVLARNGVTYRVTPPPAAPEGAR